jgi:hypothetical protein
MSGGQSEVVADLIFHFSFLHLSVSIYEAAHEIRLLGNALLLEMEN